MPSPFSTPNPCVRVVRQFGTEQTLVRAQATVRWEGRRAITSAFGGSRWMQPRGRHVKSRSETASAGSAGLRRAAPAFLDAISPLAGCIASAVPLLDVNQLLAAYFDARPDPSVPAHRVVFGTSGHRGSAFDVSFNEWHVLAIAQAICDYGARQALVARST